MSPYTFPSLCVWCTCFTHSRLKIEQNHPLTKLFTLARQNCTLFCTQNTQKSHGNWKTKIKTQNHLDEHCIVQHKIIVIFVILKIACLAKLFSKTLLTSLVLYCHLVGATLDIVKQLHEVRIFGEKNATTVGAKKILHSPSFNVPSNQY